MQLTRSGSAKRLLPEHHLAERRGSLLVARGCLFPQTIVGSTFSPARQDDSGLIRLTSGFAIGDFDSCDVRSLSYYWRQADPIPGIASRTAFGTTRKSPPVRLPSSTRHVTGHSLLAGRAMPHGFTGRGAGARRSNVTGDCQGECRRLSCIEWALPDKPTQRCANSKKGVFQ